MPLILDNQSITLIFFLLHFSYWVFYNNGNPKQTKEFGSFLYRYPLLILLPLIICCSIDKFHIFYCFTGLAYVDVFNLRENNIRTTFDESLWIIGKRIKTGVSYRVPLLNVPMQIIDKYKEALPNDEILPMISNQKMNSYLKEIAAVCGVDKNLSFHVARHTFATTVTLSKGVSIESVSKMLGHTNIKTTQIYARITDNKISDDMNNLAGKIKGLQTKFAVNQ
jgi:Site-specific recombinase XerD